MGPILFTRNENIAHVLPRVTVCAVTSCAHCTVRVAHQELLMDMPLAQAEL